tara:strand:+ start:2019 stop:2270 length:252 start_codon:yes stop_codon:yes gene_type:complete
MKIKTKLIGVDPFFGSHLNVYIDGKKFPRDKGLSYIIPKHIEVDLAREVAIEYAKHEASGKFVSGSGEFYESEAEYFKIIAEG